MSVLDTSMGSNNKRNSALVNPAVTSPLSPSVSSIRDSGESYASKKEDDTPPSSPEMSAHGEKKGLMRKWRMK
jgi:hypothetical protein